MRNRVQLAGTVIAMALLVVGLPAMAAAQTQNEGGPQVGAPSREYVPTPQINLTGMLKSDGAGGYVLVDEQSGESIELKKQGKKFAKYEGQMVTVAGKWIDDDPTSKTFRVSKVKPASDAADKSQEAADRSEKAEDKSQKADDKSQKAHGKPQSPDAPDTARSKAPEHPHSNAPQQP